MHSITVLTHLPEFGPCDGAGVAQSLYEIRLQTG
jgi:hypothetical protein